MTHRSGIRARPEATIIAGAVLLLLTSLVALAGGRLAADAQAHGAGGDDYEAVVTSIEPALPIDVELVGDDGIRFENAGDEELLVCGYEEDTCEPYVRIGPNGVFVNLNSKAYADNLEGADRNALPEGSGAGPPKWNRIRDEPAFFAYHDQRIPWISKEPPGSVDQSKPGRQKVHDWAIDVRYGDLDGTVSGTLYYVGGQTPWSRYGELLLTGGGIVAMLAVFAVDARRRRRRGRELERG